MVEFVDEGEMKDYRNMLEELLDISEGLYDNEIDFLEDLTKWEGCFTERQAAWLEKIYKRVM